MSETEIIVKMDRHIKIKGGSYVQDLVRCKDCKNRYYDKERDLYYCMMYYGLGSVLNDNYCSFGERADT